MSPLASSIWPDEQQPAAAVLGCVLLEPDLIPLVESLVSQEDFAPARCSWAWRQIRAAQEAGTTPDVLGMEFWLRSLPEDEVRAHGGIAWLSSLPELVPTTVRVEDYCRRLYEQAARRRLHSASEALAGAAREEPDIQRAVQAGERALQGIAGSLASEAWRSSRDLDQAGQVEWTRRAESSAREHPAGIPTGYRDLDALLGGWRPGDLVLVAGRPAMGKTAFLLNLLASAANHGHGTALLSLEMTSQQCWDRLCCARSGVLATRIRDGLYSPDEYQRLTTASEQLASQPIWIDDRPASILQIGSKVRRLRARCPDLRIVAVDYLQLLRPIGGRRQENREREVAEMGEGLKCLAKECEITVLSAVQVNRGPEERQNRRPAMADLRESGALEQAADAILAPFRPAYYEKEDTKRIIEDCELLILKSRHGRTGSVPLRWEPQRQR